MSVSWKVRSGRRVGEVGLAALEVRGRLAVGDHDDLLVAALVAGQQLAGEREARVHVGADVPLAPRQASGSCSAVNSRA